MEIRANGTDDVTRFQIAKRARDGNKINLIMLPRPYVKPGKMSPGARD